MSSEFINNNTLNNLENETAIIRFRCLELALTYRNFSSCSNWETLYMSIEQTTKVASVLEKYILDGVESDDDNLRLISQLRSELLREYKN